MEPCLFKVGDKVTSPKQPEYDFRYNEFVPTFTIEEIDYQDPNKWLRHTKGRTCGIASQHCVLVDDKVIKVPDKPNNHVIDKKLITDYLKFIENSDYTKVEDGVDDFINQYYEE